MISINLLPPQVKVKIKQAQNSANVFSVCLVITIVFITLIIILSSAKTNFLQFRLDNANSEISQASSQTKSFKELENKALFLNDRAKLATEIENKRAVWSQVLQDLINSVPSDVQFVSLAADLTKTPNFILQGNTTSEREIIKFKEKLENSSFFKDVSFKNSSSAESKENSLNFTLEFNTEKLVATPAADSKAVK